MKEFNGLINSTKVPKVAVAPKDTDGKRVKAPLVPTIEEQALPARIKSAVKNFISLTKKRKEVDKKLSEAGAVIIEFASKEQDNEAFLGNFSKSLNIGDVQFTTKNSFTINSSDLSTIKELLGKAFKDLIKEKKVVKLRDEVFEDDALQEKLVKKLGNAFIDFFITEAKFIVADDYDKKIYEVAHDQEKLSQIRRFVKPQKASLK